MDPFVGPLYVKKSVEIACNFYWLAYEYYPVFEQRQHNYITQVLRSNMTYRYIPKPFEFKSSTQGVAVTVVPAYVPEHSNPKRHQYVWTYNVVIENQTNKRIKLMRRHWEVIDARGHKEEVAGPGVVGEQPVLEPGSTFTYASHTMLRTSTGFMKGDYDVVDDLGQNLKVDIPAFSLDEPFERPVIN